MKRVLALVLSLLFVMTLLPAGALAAVTITNVTVSQPTKQIYLPGDTIQTAGMVITEELSDGTKRTGTNPVTYVILGRANLDIAAGVRGDVTIQATYTDEAGKTWNPTATVRSVSKYFDSIGLVLPGGATLPTSLKKGEKLSDFIPAGSTITYSYYEEGKTGVQTEAGIALDNSNVTWSPDITSAVDDAAVNAGTKNYTLRYKGSAFGNGSISTTFSFSTLGTPVTGFALNPATLDLVKDSSQQLTAVFTPDGASDSLNWKTSDNGVASVSSSGVVTARKAGTATITATTKNAKNGSTHYTATCAVTVSEPPKSPSATSDYASLALSLSNDVYINGQRFDLSTVSVKGLLPNEDSGAGTAIPAANYSVSVSRTNNSSYYYNGTATSGPVFNSTGTATVTVRYSYVNSSGSAKTISASKNVTVVESKPLRVEIITEPKKMTYYAGEKLDITGLTVKVAYTKNGSTVSGYGTQTIDDCTIPGLTDAITDAPGTKNYEIRYTDGNGIAAAPAILAVTVATPVTKITVAPETLTIPFANIASGLTSSFTVTPDPATAPASALAWENSQPKVASYTYTTAASGVTTVNVQALEPGTTRISVRARGTTDVIATCTVVVQGDPNKKVTGMNLNVNSYDMFVNTTYALYPVFLPEGASAEMEWGIVEYTPQGATSATPYATGTATGLIDDVAFLKDGTIKAMAAGSIKLKGTVKGPATLTASCLVNIMPIAIDSITLSDSSLSMFGGSGYTITGKVTPENATDKTIAWTSSDETAVKTTYTKGGVSTNLQKDPIITITPIDANSGRIVTNRENFYAYCDSKNVSEYSGFVTGIVAGGRTAKCTVTVKKGTLMTDLSLDKHSIEMAIGDPSITLNPTITPKNASNQDLTWTSSKPAVATVDAAGNIKALSAGSTVITCSSNDGSGKVDTCVVQIASVLIQSVTVSPYVSTIAEDNTVQLTANLYPGNVTSTKVVWSSADENIAKVDANGLVTGTGGGITIIRATSGDGSNVYGSAVISVKAKIAVKSVDIALGDFELLLGDSTVMKLNFKPSDATNTSATWKSSDTSVATVDADGKIVGVKLGQTNVTVTAGGRNDTVTVSVVSTLTKSGKVVNCKKRVNVRSAASGTSKQVGYANLGAHYKILGQVGNWYRIQYSSSKIGYIWANYLEVKAASASYTSSGAVGGTTGGTTTTPVTNPTKVTITNCNEFVNVRTGPGTSHTKLGTAALGSTYVYLATEGDWIKLTYNAQVAYIYENYCLLS